jgi:DNA-binding transcriptional LysR family regulator
MTPGPGLELRHLRVLLAIADRGTLTDAAAELGLSQPAVSRSLAQLEVILGAPLVARTTRELHLTAAGERVVDAARATLRAADGVVDAATGVVPPLRVGYSWAALGEHTTTVLRLWRRRHPTVALELRRVDARDAGLRRGLVDVAIVRGEFREPGVRTEWLWDESKLAALPTGHPLAARTDLRMADLASETVALTSGIGTTALDQWPPAVRPRHSIETGNTDEWLTVIAAGDAVGVTPTGTAVQHQRSGVVYVPLLDGDPVPVLAAWPQRAAHVAVPELLDLLTTLPD